MILFVRRVSVDLLVGDYCLQTSRLVVVNVDGVGLVEFYRWRLPGTYVPKQVVCICLKNQIKYVTEYSPSTNNNRDQKVIPYFLFDVSYVNNELYRYLYGRAALVSVGRLRPFIFVDCISVGLVNTIRNVQKVGNRESIRSSSLTLSL